MKSLGVLTSFAVPLVATALVAGSASGAASTGSRATVNPQRGGTITYACNLSEINTLDPAGPALGVCSRDALNAMYDTLVYVDARGHIFPSVARKWTISGDGKYYTFFLRKGVKFHDGSPVNAQAVAFSLRRMLAPTALGGARYIRGVIRRVRAAGDSVVKLTLYSPNVSMLGFLGAPFAAPIVNPAVVAAKNGNLSGTDAGSGPFTLANYKAGPNGFAEFKATPGYWKDGADGKPLPYLDGFKLVPLADNNARILNLRSGDFDIVQNVPAQFVKDVANSGFRILGNFAGLSLLLSMNEHVEPFTKPLVREAIVNGIDRKRILAIYSFGKGVLRPTALAAGGDFDIKTPDFKYDPAAAKQKLARAGYPNGLTTSITIINRQPDLQVAQVMKQQLDAIGVKLNIGVRDRAAWLAETDKGNTGMMLDNTIQVQEPELHADRWNPKGVSWLKTRWDDADAEAAWAFSRKAVQVADVKKRLAFYQKVVERVVHANTIICMGQVPAPDAGKASILGYVAKPQGEGELHRVWLKR